MAGTQDYEVLAEKSHYIRKEPCPSCGSRDNLARYSDGHAHCFGCSYYEHADGSSGKKVKAAAPLSKDLADYDQAVLKPLTARGITEETCRLFGVRVGQHKGELVHFYPYYRDGQVSACKVRPKYKSGIRVIGEGRNLPLFGQNLWGSGKKIVITEGEIDAMTVSQIQGNKWPTVSIPNGAQGAVKALQNALDYLSNFEEIILMFDMDKPGQDAARECAQLFEVGKAKIASLPFKDPNECLMNGRGEAVIQAIWNAQPYRPDGVFDAADMWDVLATEREVESIPYPWAGLNYKTLGLRRGELVTLTAGSGIGKSSVVREIAHHLIKQGETVGMIMLEESPKRTMLGLMGIEMNKPIHLSREGVTDEEFHLAFQSVFAANRVYLYDHFGSSDIDNLLNRIRFLVKACNCRWIVLDHLSIVVSGLDGDERRTVDIAMTKLRTLVEQTGCGMILVSHLKRPEGNKGHENGAQVTLAQLRSSASIGQLSDMVIGLERDQQSEDEANLLTVRVLKNRFSGDTGVCCQLEYDRNTGRLSERTPQF